MATLEIRLFGTLSLGREGQVVTRFPSRRVKELLAHLRLNRGILLAREQLAGLFWSDCDADRARHCLNTTLWRLQRVLGQPAEGEHSYLRVDAQHIGFNAASNYWLDVAEFESRCAWAERVDAPEQQAVLYRQAVSCYRADLLVECYEDWCLVERERLHARFVGALGRLLTYYSARGEVEAAIDCARRILATDPLREEVHRDLIQLYLTARQPGAALRQYRSCERILRRELETDPMPETRALLSRIIGTADPPHLAAAPLVAGSDLEQDLATALSRLKDATGTFDRARLQLGEATSMVAAILGGLGGIVPAGGGKWEGPAAGQLREAERLVSSVVQQLDRLPARAGSRY